MATSRFSSFHGLTGESDFPNAWMDVSSLAMPGNMRNAMYWAEFLYSVGDGTYRAAMERVGSYFLTTLKVDAGEDERAKWEPMLNDTLGLMRFCHEIVNDRLAYGNGFGSIIVPFKRFLSCPQCRKAQYALNEIATNDVFRFQWQLPEFTATCPVCKVGSGYTGRWSVDDRPDNVEKKLILKRWSPHEIELLHDPYTDQVDYLWRIPEHYKRLIKQGHLYHLERVSKEVLRAVANNC